MQVEGAPGNITSVLLFGFLDSINFLCVKDSSAVYVLDITWVHLSWEPPWLEVWGFARGVNLVWFKIPSTMSVWLTGSVEFVSKGNGTKRLTTVQPAMFLAELLTATSTLTKLQRTLLAMQSNTPAAWKGEEGESAVLFETFVLSYSFQFKKAAPS